MAQILKAIRDAQFNREMQLILSALEGTGGNVAKAARNLGMSRYSIIRRLERYERMLVAHAMNYQAGGQVSQ